MGKVVTYPVEHQTPQPCSGSHWSPQCVSSMHSLSGAVPSMTETAGALRSIWQKGKKAVGPDEIPAEQLKLIVDDNDTTLTRFMKPASPGWNRGGVPQEWKDDTMTVLHETDESAKNTGTFPS